MLLLTFLLCPVAFSFVDQLPSVSQQSPEVLGKCAVCIRECMTSEQRTFFSISDAYVSACVLEGKEYLTK